MPLPNSTDISVLPENVLAANPTMIPTKSVIEPPANKSAVVNSKKLPLTDIITYVSGKPMSVKEYYSQVLGSDDELKTQQVNQSGVYQQYTKYINFEVRVQDALQPSYSPESGESTYTGSATTYPFFTPNVGDMFCLDIGDGREGIFAITDVTDNSLFEKATHSISYTLTNYGTGVAANKADLESKVVATKVFRKDFLQSDKNPYLTVDENASYDSLTALFTSIVNSYFTKFYSVENSMLLYKDVNGSYGSYDPWIIKFLKTILSVDDDKRLLNLNSPSLAGSYGADNVLCVWDLIFKQDIGLIPFITTQMWLVSTAQFPFLNVLNSVKFANIDGCVYPNGYLPNLKSTTVTGGDPLYTATVATYDPLAITSTSTLGDFNYDYTQSPLGIVKPAAFYPVTTLTTYVFSNNFYTQAELGQSAIELLVGNMLRNEYIDGDYLLTLNQLLMVAEPITQFYLYPVLMMLIKYTLTKM